MQVCAGSRRTCYTLPIPVSKFSETIPGWLVSIIQMIVFDISPNFKITSWLLTRYTVRMNSYRSRVSFSFSYTKWSGESSLALNGMLVQPIAYHFFELFPKLISTHLINGENDGKRSLLSKDWKTKLPRQVHEPVLLGPKPYSLIIKPSCLTGKC